MNPHISHTVTVSQFTHYVVSSMSSTGCWEPVKDLILWVELRGSERHVHALFHQPGTSE